MKKILFVCLGNICRSPMGEGAVKSIVKHNSLISNYFIDSAGISAHHIGEKADKRMRDIAYKHGIKLTSKSRKVVLEDFDNFDLIIAMDNSNLRNLEKMANHNKKYLEKIKLMRAFDTLAEVKDVPDPYYGKDDEFEEVYQIVYRSCENLFKYLESKM